MIHPIKIRKRTDEEYRSMNYYSIGTFYRISPQKVATSSEIKSDVKPKKKKKA